MKEKDMDSRIERLPKWAQGEISRLQSNAKYWKTKVLEMSGGHSDTFVLQGLADRMYLPSGALIQFVGKDEEDWYDNRFSVRLRYDHLGKPFLEVDVSGMRIEPRAANLVYIHKEER